MKSRKAIEYISTTLICVMLVSILVTSGIKPVKAPAPVITLYAALSTEKYQGWQAGYHDAMKAVQTELEKIGIDLVLTYWDPGTIYETCWYTWWDKASPTYTPPTGWDMTTGEQWLYPYGLVWLGAFVYEEGTPIAGGNVGPWLNPKADRIYKRAETELDPVKRKEWLWKWQEIYMHDVPRINMFYAVQYEAVTRWLTGYDYGCCYGHRWYWTLNNTDPENPRPGTAIFGIDDTMYAGTSPIFVNTYSQELFCDLCWDTLYMLSRDPFPPVYNDTLWTPEMLEAYPYKIVPDVAAGMPVYEDDTTLIVPLRDDVSWVWPPNATSNDAVQGPNMTAKDVVFTFEALLDPVTANPGYGDFEPIIESVEALTNVELQTPKYQELYDGYNYTEHGVDVQPWCEEVVYFREPYVVRVNLKQPHADIELLLCDAWGAIIAPEFVLGDLPHSALITHPSNFDPSQLPMSGPFYLKKGGYEVDVRMTLDKNPFWWGTDEGLMTTIDTFVLEMIPDAAARKIALLAHEIDFGEAIPMPIAEYEALRTPGSGSYDPLLRIHKTPRMTSNPIWLNMRNPDLANRYLRMAIAHAVPYKKIVENVIPSWGLTAAFPGVENVPLTEGVFPYHIISGELMYHTELEPYGYNLTKAAYYRDLYLNQTNGDYTKAPLGDADQSGLVDLTDWWIWRERKGAGVTTPIDIYPTWPYAIDPDFDNNGDVLDEDVLLWSKNYGTAYEPFVYGVP